MNLGALRLAFRPVVTSLVSTRNKLFTTKNLLYTNTTICVSSSVVGDVFMQWFHARNKDRTFKLDGRRTLNMAVSGLLIGPFVHHWYFFLDRRFPGKTFGVLCKKVAMDTLVCSPIYLTILILSLGIMEGKNLAEVKRAFVDKGSVLGLGELAVWPPAQMINFYLLPTRYRVLYDNTISLVLDGFWSYVWYEMEESDGNERKQLETTESA